MQDMLRKIISVDKKAKEAVSEAKSERENVEKKLSEAEKAIRNGYLEKTETEIAAQKERLINEFNEKEAKTKEDFELRKRTLEEKFELMNDKWALEIARKAIED